MKISFATPLLESTCAAWSPDGCLLAAIQSQQHAIDLLDSGLAAIRTFACGGRVSEVSWAPDSRTVAALLPDTGFVHFFDATPRAERSARDGGRRKRRKHLRCSIDTRHAGLAALSWIHGESVAVLSQHQLLLSIWHLQSARVLHVQRPLTGTATRSLLLAPPPVSRRPSQQQQRRPRPAVLALATREADPDADGPAVVSLYDVDCCHFIRAWRTAIRAADASFLCVCASGEDEEGDEEVVIIGSLAELEVAVYSVEGKLVFGQQPGGGKEGVRPSLSKSLGEAATYRYNAQSNMIAGLARDGMIRIFSVDGRCWLPPLDCVTPQVVYQETVELAAPTGSPVDLQPRYLSKTKSSSRGFFEKPITKTSTKYTAEVADSTLSEDRRHTLDILLAPDSVDPAFEKRGLMSWSADGEHIAVALCDIKPDVVKIFSLSAWALRAVVLQRHPVRLLSFVGSDSSEFASPQKLFLLGSYRNLGIWTPLECATALLPGSSSCEGVRNLTSSDDGRRVALIYTDTCIIGRVADDP